MDDRRMIRWVAQTKRINRENETLQNIVIYPPGVSKEEVKREQQYSHHRELLIPNEGVYTYRR